MTKEQVLICLEALPDSFEPERLIDRLIALMHLEEGLEQVRRGEVVTVEEAKSRLAFAAHLRERLAQADRDEGVAFEEARRRLMPPSEDAS
jgi:hypothetical protein